MRSPTTIEQRRAIWVGRTNDLLCDVMVTFCGPGVGDELVSGGWDIMVDSSASVAIGR